MTWRDTMERLLTERRKGWRGQRTNTTMGCNRCRAYVSYTKHPCHWNNCNEFYCDWCGRYLFGAGAAGCPCDSGTNIAGQRGHRTRAEQPRPAAPHRAAYGHRKGHR